LQAEQLFVVFFEQRAPVRVKRAIDVVDELIVLAVDCAKLRAHSLESAHARALGLRVEPPLGSACQLLKRAW
jgi:hypothetical protein